MAWDAENSSTQLTSITTEQFFDDAPQLNPGEVVHGRVDVNFPTTPTDDAIVSFYGTMDGTNWDDTPFMVFVVDKDTDPNQISYVVRDVYQFRIGVKRSGSTDTLTSADHSFRTDAVDLTA